MLNIGGGELLIILLVALIFLGPQRLPEVARQVGQTVNQLRGLARGFQAELEAAARPAPASTNPDPGRDLREWAGEPDEPTSSDDGGDGGDSTNGADAETEPAEQVSTDPYALADKARNLSHDAIRPVSDGGPVDLRDADLDRNTERAGADTNVEEAQPQARTQPQTQVAGLESEVSEAVETAGAETDAATSVQDEDA